MQKLFYVIGAVVVLAISGCGSGNAQDTNRVKIGSIDAGATSSVDPPTLSTGSTGPSDVVPTGSTGDTSSTGSNDETVEPYDPDKSPSGVTLDEANKKHKKTDKTVRTKPKRKEIPSTRDKKIKKQKPAVKKRPDRNQKPKKSEPDETTTPIDPKIEKKRASTSLNEALDILILAREEDTYNRFPAGAIAVRKIQKAKQGNFSVLLSNSETCNKKSVAKPYTVYVLDDSDRETVHLAYMAGDGKLYEISKIGGAKRSLSAC